MPRRYTAKRVKRTKRSSSKGRGSAFKSYTGRVRWAPATGTGALGVQWSRYNSRGALPNTYNGVLTYVEDQNLASGAVGVVGTTATYYLNSIYSPRSAGGHQPMEHDSWATLYTQYQVTRIEIQIRFYATGTNYNVAALMIHPSSDTSSITGENPLTTGEREGGQIVQLSTDGQRVDQIVNFNFTPGEIDGYSRATNLADVNRYAASFGASPSAIPKLEIGLGNVNSDASQVMRYTIYIRYHVKMIGRKALAQS